MSPSIAAKAAAVGLGVIVLLGMVMVPLAHVAVAEGHVGVETNKGAATGNTYSPGWAWQNPVTEDVHPISVRPNTVTMNGDDEIYVITEDGQDVFVDITVRYKVNESEAVTFFKQYKSHKRAINKLIEPTLRSDIRDEGSALGTREIITKEGRETLSDVARESLQENFRGSGLELEAVQIRNVRLNDQYSNELEKVEVEKTKKQKRMIQANKTAEAKKIEAQGEAAAEVERAEGDAEAAKIRDEELTQKVLTDKWLDEIDDSDKVIINGEPIARADDSEGNNTSASPDMIIDASEDN